MSVLVSGKQEIEEECLPSFNCTPFQNFFLLFMCGLYLFRICEAIYAARRCRQLGLDNRTTLKWVSSAFLSGFFALRLLPHHS